MITYTGTSAYAGAAQLISNKTYLTVAATILSTEARHASWIAAAVNKFGGWSGPFDVGPTFFSAISHILIIDSRFLSDSTKSSVLLHPSSSHARLQTLSFPSRPSRPSRSQTQSLVKALLSPSRNYLKAQLTSHSLPGSTRSSFLSRMGK